MSGRELRATINGMAVGTLFEADGLWAFRYAPEWLAAPSRFALSPALPLQAEALADQGSLRPVQWFFDNLLPEEGQRQLLARDVRVEVADAFGLLQAYGAESAGSLVLLPPDADTTADGRAPLPDAALAARIRQLPQLPLTHGAAKRMSLAGAQHKLAVLLQGDALFEPAGATPSTHILKPDHPDADYPHSVINEWFTMRLAAAAGLPVPTVARRYVPMPVYLVQRFDRVTDNGRTRRLHAIDACQLLSLDRSYKYRQGSVERLAELASACRSAAIARAQLFDWLVFNVLVGNTDAHLKNLSFLVSAEGIQLAPFYDLLGIAAYDTRAFDKDRWPEWSTLAWPILGVSRFAGLTRPLLLEAGRVLGLKADTAARRLDALRETVQTNVARLQAETDATNTALLDAEPALAATFAGERRLLRALEHNIIRPMLAQLA